MKVTCPHCHRLLSADDINVATDLAHCRACNEAFALSELVAQGCELFDPGSLLPPPGAWFTRDAIEVCVGATTRSLWALFFVPFVCLWSGMALNAIYGRQFVSGQWSLRDSLFGIPFVLLTVLFGAVAVLSVCGKTEVRLCGDEGRIFVGVGPIGWTRRFSRSEIRAIREGTCQGPYSGKGVSPCIVLEGPRRIHFASAVSSERRDFMMQALRHVLLRER